jgi:uncharacterized FlgJ-related protein
MTLFTLATVFIVEATENKKIIIEQEYLIRSLIDEKDSTKETITIHTKIGKATLEKNSVISIDSINAYVDKLPFYYPDIIKAQIALESNYATSTLFKSTNNLFGMKKVYSRNTTQENINYNGYGTYKNYKLSILDRILWDYNIFKKKPSRKEYLDTLAVIYAEDENYIKKLTNIIK